MCLHSSTKNEQWTRKSNLSKTEINPISKYSYFFSFLLEGIILSKKSEFYRQFWLASCEKVWTVESTFESGNQFQIFLKVEVDSNSNFCKIWNFGVNRSRTMHTKIEQITGFFIVFKDYQYLRVFFPF